MAEENTPEREAIRTVESIRHGNLDITTNGDDDMGPLLRESLTEAEKIRIHQRFITGELSEGAARILLGDDLGEFEREESAFTDAMELADDDLFQE